jgi:hypothetical protein
MQTIVITHQLPAKPRDAGVTGPRAAQEVTTPDSEGRPMSLKKTAQPLLTVFDPPIELASARPRGGLDLDGRVNFAAICCGQVLQFGIGEIHYLIRTYLRFWWKRATPGVTCIHLERGLVLGSGGQALVRVRGSE